MEYAHVRPVPTIGEHFRDCENAQKCTKYGLPSSQGLRRAET